MTEQIQTKEKARPKTGRVSRAQADPTVAVTSIVLPRSDLATPTSSGKKLKPNAVNRTTLPKHKSEALFKNSSSSGIA